MVAVFCLQCEPRWTVYLISIVSFLHFIISTIILGTLDTDHRLVFEDDGIKYYIVLAIHIFLIVASVLLFLSAYFLRRYLVIPWIIGCVWHLIILATVFVIIMIRSFSGRDGVDIKVEIAKAFLIFFTIITLSYCIFIVVVFFIELGRRKSSDLVQDPGEGRKSRKSLLVLPETTDTDGETGDEERGLFGMKRKKLKSASKHNAHKGTDEQPLLR